MKMKHIFSLCMIFVMLFVLCALSGCKGKQGKEIEVDVSSNPTSFVESQQNNINDSTDGDSSVSSGKEETTDVEQSDSPSSQKGTSSEATVIIGEDVVIDMGEELF